LAKGEEIALRTISTTKKHKSSKKKISFRISEDHSTEAALGYYRSVPIYFFSLSFHREFSRLSNDERTSRMREAVYHALQVWMPKPGSNHQRL
jgi:hypothetical protein